MKKFVVYFHFTPDTNELFYIGEGTIVRAYSKFSRNKWWKYKVLKHKGFKTIIIKDNLFKFEAENLEKILIKENYDYNLTNLCQGTMFGSHWLIGKPKEMHPMFGKKRPEQSIKITEWNKNHKGKDSPVFGLKRPDLVERNKLKNFKRTVKKVRCIETGQIFPSIKEACNLYPSKHYSRAIKNGHKLHGFHWEYFTEISA